MTKLKLLVACAIPLLMVGCYYDIEEELYPEPCPIPESPTYSEHIEPLVLAKCATAGCHVTGGGGPGDFTTYDGIEGYISGGEFEVETVIDRSMPPSGALPNCEIQLIEAWIAAGTPQ